MASTSQEDLEQDVAILSSSNRILKVTLLASEWGSSTNDLSTFNRELAKYLAKLENVEVTMFVLNCHEEDKRAAKDLGITIIKAKERPGYEPIDWLAFPPTDLSIDIVVGHSVELGHQAQSIRDTHNCKWVQVVHANPEEDAMYKSCPDAISKGEELYNTELDLCKMADHVVAVGPKLAEAIRASLQFEVSDFTPGIFSEFSCVKQADQDAGNFRVLLFSVGGAEDFKLKGYDIAAQAIAKLDDTTYRLIFAGAPDGQKQVVKSYLLGHGINPSQLSFRGFHSSSRNSREKLSELFCVADLAIMPSRTEGFGLTALEALSAGLPILVSSNSGFGKALKKLSFGASFVVDSEDSEVWAREIKRLKERKYRLLETQDLQSRYANQFDWDKQCEALEEKWLQITNDPSDSHGRTKRSILPAVCNMIPEPQQVHVFSDLKQLHVKEHWTRKNVDILDILREIAKRKGFSVSDNPGGGNCMFYALAEQLRLVERISISHDEVRRKLVGFLRENPKQANGTDLFSFVDGYSAWTNYLTDLGKDGTWGDHIILVAAANYFQVPIRVISSLHDHDDVIIQPESPVGVTNPIVLGHVHELHYVSLQSMQAAPSSRLEVGSSFKLHQSQVRKKRKRKGKGSRSAKSAANRPTLERCHQVRVFDFPRLVSFIKEEYIRRARLQPVPWCSTSNLSLDRVYTRLVMKARKMQSPELTSQEVNMYDIFRSHENCKNPRWLLVEGVAGIGKTTFCQKLAKDWASEEIPKGCSFPEFELVLLLKCRDIDTGVQDAIEKQLVPCYISDKQKSLFLDYVQHVGNKVLVILDGLDELKRQEIKATADSEVDVVLTAVNKIIPHCFLVVTARQERGIQVREKFDTLLEIEGFTKDDAMGYIQCYFQEKQKEHLASALKEKVNVKLLEGLLKNPLNTTLLCLVFEDCDGKLPSKRTELYQIIVFCILKRFCTRQKISFDDSTLFQQFEGVLLALGKLALDGLKMDSVYISEKTLNGNSQTQQLPHIGFVSKEASAKFIKPEHHYFFPHKTIQEFFAALYLEDMLKKGMNDAYKFIFSIDDITGKFRQVFLFVAGLLGKGGNVHFELLGEQITRHRNGFNHPWYFLVESWEESGHAEAMLKAMAPFMPIPACLANGHVASIDVYCFEGSFRCMPRKQSDSIIINGDVALPSGLQTWLENSQSEVSLGMTIFFDKAKVEHEPGLLVKYLSKNKSLSRLIVNVANREIHVRDTGLAFLAEVLSENKSLRSLTLVMSFCDLSNATLSPLGDGLSQNQSVTSLSLDMSQCDLSNATLSSLGDGLSQIQSLTSLKLGMHWCDLSNAALPFLGQGLSQNQSLTSLWLDMSQCDLSNATLSSLGDGLSQIQSLTSLKLGMHWCDLSNAALPFLGQGLSQNQSLTSLKLGMHWCDLSNAALPFLGQGLSQNQSLTSLKLFMHRCDLSNAALPFLGRGLSQNQSLTSLWLDMSQCDLSNAALPFLGQGLSQNQSLTSLSLDMSQCDLSNATLSSLGDGLSQNQSLTSLKLFMRRCDLSNAALPFLGQGLLQNQSLTSLKLFMRRCDLSNAALAFLSQGLSQNQSLRSLSLDISYSRVNSEELALVDKAIQDSKSLTSVTLRTHRCQLVGEASAMALFSRDFVSKGERSFVRHPGRCKGNCHHQCVWTLSKP